MLRTKLYSVPKGGENAPFLSPASEAPILVRNESLTYKEYKTKSCL